MGTTLETTVRSAADSAGASATSAAASARYCADAIAHIESDVAQVENDRLAVEAARANAEYHSSNYIPGPVGPEGPPSTVPGPEGPRGFQGDPGLVVVEHGADPNVARPDCNVCYWVGSVEPVNALPYDWFKEN